MRAETRKTKAIIPTSTQRVCGTIRLATGTPNSDSMTPLKAHITKAATANEASKFKAVSLMSIP